MRATLGVLLALAAAGPRSLFAQAPAERAALEALRDSLARAPDSVALRRVEAATIAVAKQHRDSALLHLRLGFIAYRLGELARSKDHFDDAAGEVEWASELQRAGPCRGGGRGAVELAEGEPSAVALAKPGSACVARAKARPAW